MIAVPDERWSERPLVAVVLEAGHQAVRRRAARVPERPGQPLVAPERWVFIEEVPKTSVGKFDKKVLRAQYADGEFEVVEVEIKTGR